MGNNFELTILGCGSATPTILHNPSSQVLELREKLFMIDCGEGAQIEFRRNKLRFGRISHIFISHLHGDHCFGLIGLISSLSLLGRIGTLFIHAHHDLEAILRPQINYFCTETIFNIEFIPFNPSFSEVIYEDKSLTVTTIPLIHRVPCAGFLFKEKPKEANLIGDMIRFHEIPIKELAAIKKGSDYITPNGMLVENKRLVIPAKPPLSYAYCSDTAYCEKIVHIIKDVDLLYHEATFMDAELLIAKKTGHSTGTQAAKIASMAKAKCLLLGHYSSRYSDNKPLLEEARTIFQNTLLANEGLHLSF